MRLHPVVSGFLAILIVLSSVPVVRAAGPYDDAYRFLASAGVIADAGTDNSDEAVSRAEVLQTLLDLRADTRQLADWYRGRPSDGQLFHDIPSDDSFASYAKTAIAAGIATGYPDGTFRPDHAVTAEQGIVLVMRTFRVPGEGSAGALEWFAPFIRAAMRRKLLATPRAMAIGLPITRGQFYDVLYRTATISRGNLAVFPGPVSVAAAPAQGGQVAAPARVPSSPIAPVAQPSARLSSGSSDAVQYASSNSFAISIPSLGIKDLPVNHPEDTLSSKGVLSVLNRGVGHLFGWPGSDGKIMIYGHSSGYAWDVSKYTKIFRTVNKLKPGDKVYVTYNGILHVYSVTGQQTISPTDSSPFAGSGEELILYTCWPPDSVKQRLIVRAVPVERVALR